MHTHQIDTHTCTVVSIKQRLCDRSHSTNPRLNPGQQHFQSPYGQAGSNQPQPSPLTYQSSPNFSPQSKTSSAATRCVSSNWTCIGKIDGADTFNINKLHVLIYTSDRSHIPFLNRPYNERCRTLDVPCAETYSVDIDIDNLE